MLDEKFLLDTTTAETALGAFGWKENSIGSFRRKEAEGTAELQLLQEDSGWHRWRLRCRGLPAPNAERHLHEQRALRGPVKLVALEDGDVIARVDAPLEWQSPAAAATSQESSPAGLALHDPWHVWAQALTETLAPPESDMASLPELPLASYEQELKLAGWPASLDDGHLHVHVQLPGLFRQIALEKDASGFRVTAHLADIGHYGEPSRQAVLRQATEANRRLPLVRLLIDENTSSSVMRAEVHLGRALIPGAWLATAIDVVAAAVALTARELQVLRDPELAHVVLAAAAA